MLISTLTNLVDFLEALKKMPTDPFAKLETVHEDPGVSE